MVRIIIEGSKLFKRKFKYWITKNREKSIKKSDFDLNKEIRGFFSTEEKEQPSREINVLSCKDGRNIFRSTVRLTYVNCTYKSNRIV